MNKNMKDILGYICIVTLFVFLSFVLKKMNIVPGDFSFVRTSLRAILACSVHFLYKNVLPKE